MPFGGHQQRCKILFIMIMVLINYGLLNYYLFTGRG